jgi:putative endonuclease
MYFVYILECADKSFYVGCTNNLEKRIKEHNEYKRGAHYTKIRRPVELRYSETFDNLKNARRRETEIKGWRRDKKINLINAKSRRIKQVN